MKFKIAIFICFLIIGCRSTYTPADDNSVAPISKKSPDTNLFNEANYAAVAFTIDSLLKMSQSQLIDYKHLNAFNKTFKISNTGPWFKSNLQIYDGIAQLKNAVNHGLNPSDYGLIKVDSLYKSYKEHPDDLKLLAVLQINVMKGLRLITKHLVYGTTNPVDFHPGWNIKKANINIDSLICQALALNQIDKLDHLAGPKDQEYWKLVELNAKLIRAVAEQGPYNGINFPGFTLHEGDSNDYVSLLKQRLSQAGLFHGDINLKFDAQLSQSIKRFQQMHGLTPDGVPGRQTYLFLSWGSEKYLQTLKVNLERLRWISNPGNSTEIRVNIPSYSLIFNNGTDTLFATRVIVGKDTDPTPVFQSAVTYLVFNPCWTVPNSIASDKMLKKLQADADYLQNHNMFICKNGVEINPDSVDFSAYNQSNFPFKIYQRTSDDNALGKVKFIFDNPYSIYLHDTPSKYLFNKDIRAFSHGCIRVQNALKLAEVLLSRDHQVKKVDSFLEPGYPVKYYLHKTAPLKITYLTCGYNNKLQQVLFYNDIYLYDTQLAAVLSNN